MQKRNSKNTRAARAAARLDPPANHLGSDKANLRERSLCDMFSRGSSTSGGVRVAVVVDPSPPPPSWTEVGELVAKLRSHQGDARPGSFGELFKLAADWLTEVGEHTQVREELLRRAIGVVSDVDRTRGESKEVLDAYSRITLARFRGR